MEKIVLCGGGTLGHFTPNIAIYENLNDKYDFCYICSKSGIEKEMVKNIMPYYEIETAKFKRNFSISNFLIPFKLLKGIFDAKKVLKKEKPALIFSKGGFASVPVVLAGCMLKIPCITHESDKTLGLANKIISKKCKYVCTSFEETAKKLHNGIYTGNPIRKQVFNGNKEKTLKKLGFFDKKPIILVLGGSLGSETINSQVRNALDKLSEFNIIHITGKGKKNDAISKANYVQIEYAKDIENYYACADLVITRGGSNTLFELLALKKTMIIIPLGTNASRGDQILNANEFQKNGYANVIFEENLNKKTLVDTIYKTFSIKGSIQANISNTYKNGTKTICDLIEKTISEIKKAN